VDNSARQREAEKKNAVSKKEVGGTRNRTLKQDRAPRGEKKRREVKAVQPVMRKLQKPTRGIEKKKRKKESV